MRGFVKERAGSAESSRLSMRLACAMGMASCTSVGRVERERVASGGLAPGTVFRLWSATYGASGTRMEAWAIRLC